MKKVSTLIILGVLLGFAPQYIFATEGIITKKLMVGTKNSEVKTLQEILIREGYLTGVADGSFGQKTLKALKAFQLAKNLQVDGITGPKTRALLLDNLNSNTNSKVIPATNPQIKNITTTQKTAQPGCNGSKCVTLLSPNGGGTFYTGQKLNAQWKSTGFDSSFREKKIYLVRKDGDTYTVLYNLASGTDRGSYGLLPLPYGLKEGSNYALKIRNYNASGQEAIDYSDTTFTIKPSRVSNCKNTSLNITMSPDFNIDEGGAGLLGSFDLSVGGEEDCIATITKIKYRANTKVRNWSPLQNNPHEKTSIDGDILTVSMYDNPFVLSAEWMSVPDKMGTPDARGSIPVLTYKKQPPGALNLDYKGDFDSVTGIKVKLNAQTNTVTKDTTNSLKSFIDPIFIEAVDINGDQITNIVGLKK